MECAGQVDPNDIVPHFFGNVFSNARKEDSRVRHDNIEAADLIYPVVHSRAKGRTVADVDLRRDNAAAQASDTLNRLGQVRRGRPGVERRHGLDVTRDIQGNDVGSLFSEPQGMASPLAPGCTRYQSHLSLNATGHDRSFLVELSQNNGLGRERDTAAHDPSSGHM
jgi:hypothetical protein